MSSAINPKLIVLSGPLAGATFALPMEEFSIGRDPSSTLCLNDTLISRQHAVIRRERDTYNVVDLSSRNGTFVNTVPVVQRRLEHGDRIQIGDSLLLFALADSETPPAPPVRFDETAPLSRSLVRLRKQDSLYLNPLKTPAVTDRMAKDLGTLLKISTQLNSAREPDELQRQLLKEIFDAVPADAGAILLVDSDSREQNVSTLAGERDRTRRRAGKHRADSAGRSA